MRRTILIFGFALLALNCAGLLLFNTPSTHAKVWGFSNADLWGSYASQLSGTIVFPADHPMAIFNGPYALTGRVWADGQGNAKGTVYDNYGGLLLNYSWNGTYQVNEDGTFKLSTTLSLFGQPYPLVMFGVICDEGKQVRLLQIGPTSSDPRIPSMPSVGSVITGSWMRQ